MESHLTSRFLNLTQLAQSIEARLNCIKSNNTEWKAKHEETIDEILKTLPHGSGLDRGVQINLDKSTSTKIIFDTAFHHINGHGYYDGWTDHQIIITPSFGGFKLRITGQDKNGIKEYLYQLFSEVFHACTESETYEMRKAKISN